MPSNHYLQLHPHLPSVKCVRVHGCAAKRLQYMKRLLAAAIALSTLGALPVAAETALRANPNENQSSIWLILAMGNGLNDGALLSLPMKSMDQCEEQGAVYITSERISNHFPRGFECLEGK